LGSRDYATAHQSQLGIVNSGRPTTPKGVVDLPS